MNLQAVPGEPSAIVRSIYKLCFYVTQLSTRGQIEFMPALPIFAERVVIIFFFFSISLWCIEQSMTDLLLKSYGRQKGFLTFSREIKALYNLESSMNKWENEGTRKVKGGQWGGIFYWTNFFFHFFGICTCRVKGGGGGRSALSFLQVFRIASFPLLGSKEVTQCPLVHYSVVPCNKQKKALIFPLISRRQIK